MNFSRLHRFRALPAFCALAFWFLSGVSDLSTAPTSPSDDEYFSSEIYERETPEPGIRPGRSRKEEIRRRLETIEKRTHPIETGPADPPGLEPLGPLDPFEPQPGGEKLRTDFDLSLLGLFDAMDANKPGGRTRYHETGFVRAKGAAQVEYGPTLTGRADLRATHFKSNYRRTDRFEETWLEINKFDAWELDGTENASSNGLSTFGARELWARYETPRFGIRMGRQNIDWSENRHFDPFNVAGRHSPFTLLPAEQKGSDAIQVTGILSKSTAIDLVAAFHESGQYRGAKPNSLYQDLILRLESTVVDGLDINLVGGWKARRSLGGLELAGETGNFRFRLGAIAFSPFVLDPDAPNEFIENRYKFRSENRSFAQSSGQVEYTFNDAFVLGLAYFYNGGANRFRPVTYRGMTRQTEDSPDRDVYDLRRGHINTYRPGFAGLSITGAPLEKFTYELYVYVDHEGDGVMAAPLLVYEPGGMLALQLGGRVYSTVKNRRSDFSDRDNELFFAAEWKFF